MHMCIMHVKSCRSEKKLGYKARTFILYFLLLTSLVSVPFIKRTLLHCCTRTHTHRQAVLIQRDSGVAYEGKRT